VNAELGSEARGLDDHPIVLIERFHGHVGPYVTLGYLAGKLARDRLGVSAFKLQAEVYAGASPPMSCFVDGVQLGSGCTLGKGNIRLHEEKLVQAVFRTDDGRSLSVAVTRDVLSRVESREEDMVRLSEALMDLPLESIFALEEG
jgi:formylmethanofuran dehydrogenase subunit E